MSNRLIKDAIFISLQKSIEINIAKKYKIYNIIVYRGLFF